MNLRTLQYIIVAAQYQNFGKAAQIVYTTKPTLSIQIKKFELEFGVLLFKRNHQSVEITEIGSKVVAQARVIVEECESLRMIASGKPAR